MNEDDDEGEDVGDGCKIATMAGISRGSRYQEMERDER